MTKVLLILVLAASSAWAVPPLCGPADDPCVVTQDLTLAGGESFDLGSRAFVVAANRGITVRDDGSVAIRARSITLGANAKIVGLGPSGFEESGGAIALQADETVELGPGSLLDVSNWYAGSIDIVAGGAIRLLGLVRGTATSRDGGGASVIIDNSGAGEAGDVRIAGGGVQASGGNRYGYHGIVEVFAGDDVDVLAPVISRGGEGSDGGVFVSAGGDIMTGPQGDVDVTEFAAGYGSYIALYADRTVTTDGRLLATAAGTGGGYGGSIDIEGRGGVTIRGLVEATGESEFGQPGQMQILAPDGDVVIDADITARGHRDWEWCELWLQVGGDLTVRGTVDFSGAYSNATFNANVEGTARIEGRIITTGAYEPGRIEISACDIELPAGSLLDARGLIEEEEYGYSLFETGGVMTVGGTLRFNEPLYVIYRDTPPVVLPGAVVVPSLDPYLDPSIPCCHCTPVCGDGRRDDGETCDDGNLTDGDCCSSTCQADAAGGACDDGSTCTTGDVCDGAGSCEGAPLACDDCERCDEGVGCVVGPKAACSPIVVPGSGQIDVKDRTPDAGDAVTWQWRRGAVTPLHAFGDPIGATDFALCVFAGPTDLLLRARVPHGGSCGGRPCWKPIGTRGFTYGNSSGAPDGVYKMKMLAGPAGKASIMVKGRGAALPTAPLGGVAMPVTVQLQASHGACWESTHSIASMNVPAQLKAKSD